MANQKTYVGKGKVVGNFGAIAFSVCIDTIMPHVFEHQGKKYVKLQVSKMQSTDEHGKTHTVYVDDFKPDPTKARGNAGASSAVGTVAYPKEVMPNGEEINPDDIPF